MGRSSEIGGGGGPDVTFVETPTKITRNREVDVCRSQTFPWRGLGIPNYALGEDEVDALSSNDALRKVTSLKLL